MLTLRAINFGTRSRLLTAAERVHQTVAHDVPQLGVARLRHDDQMLARRRHFDVAYRTGPRDGHRADLRRQRNWQPTGHRHQQRHRVAVAPGGGRAHRDTQQRVVVLVVLGDRPQPGDELDGGGGRAIDM